MIELKPGDQLPDAFFELARDVNNNDPVWLPEDPLTLSKTWHSDNPYFKKATAKGWLLAGNCRAISFFDPAVMIDGKKVAYFGYWETHNDLSANLELFSCIESWAKTQGAEKIYGPIDFNTYGKYRIKLNFSGQETCFIGEPHNPQYYGDLLSAAGYQPEVRYQSQILNHVAIEKLYESKKPLLESLKNLPFRIEPLTPDFWVKNLDGFYALIDSIFSQNFAYSPISKEGFLQSYGDSFAARFCPETSLVAVSPAGQVLGFCIGFPDYAPLCRQSANPRVALQDLNYADHFHQLKEPVLLVKTAGLLPQFRNQGLLNAMSLLILERGRKIYPNAIMCLIKEGNYSAEFCKDIAAFIRWYGLFSRQIV